MNIFFKEIQKSFNLLDQEGTKWSSFMTALEYMLKIAGESKYETEKCFIQSDSEGDMIIMITTQEARLMITANINGISYTGTGPKEEDNILLMNSRASYSVSDEVFDWIQRNRK